MSETKEAIIEQIKLTAKRNNNIPLGMKKFTNETGITAYEWGKHWAKFSDAQKEAGFEGNKFGNKAYDDNFMISEIINLIRELGKFPAEREISLKSERNSTFPSRTAYKRFGGGSQIGIMNKVLKHCQNHENFEDIIKICTDSTLYKKDILNPINKSSTEIENSNNTGEVYLFKSGNYYKIGKTRDMVRRGTEIKIQLPEELILIHSIKTDDVSGIESYWHKRFAEKRMKGEWFDLNANDIKAFKKWKRIF